MQNPAPFLALLAALLLPRPAGAQLDDRWAAFEQAADRVVAAHPVADSDHEADLACGDLDVNGEADLVVVRKEPFMTLGRRTNVLLLGIGGKLVDRTEAFASRSDVEGDRGFLTPTNDRDVVVADLDGDGFPECVTAVDQSPGAPKHVSHPRVYANLGRDEDRGWRGLAHEDGRFPALVHLDSGEPILPHFMAVAAGDVDADGDLDLYFGDYDLVIRPGEERPGMQEPGEDGDDRLLLNDGKGSFRDASAERVAREALASRFCNSVVLVDLNMDERVDLLKQTSYQRPSVAFAVYNDAEEPGELRARQDLYTGRPYFVSTGDLNNDERPDVVISENGLDRHVYNLGTAEDGTVRWSEPRPFEFLHGEDDKFAGNSLIVDLDGDGWRDVIVTDVDPEIPTYDRRTHLYHNRGGTVGGDDVVLREERQLAGDGGWVGAVGLTAGDLGGTHDAAVFDLNRDGELDLLLCRRAGLEVWLQVDPPEGELPR